MQTYITQLPTHLEFFFLAPVALKAGDDRYLFFCTNKNNAQKAIGDIFESTAQALYIRLLSLLNDLQINYYAQKLLN